MIFKPQMVRMIERGAKTQTRRPLREHVAPDDPASNLTTPRRPGARPRRRSTPNALTRIDGCWYRKPPDVGTSVAVQPGRGKRAACRVVITDLRLERVGEITPEDARREGFQNVEQFKAYWVGLYDSAWVRRVDPMDCPRCHELITVVPADYRCPDCNDDLVIPLPLDRYVERFHDPRPTRRREEDGALIVRPPHADTRVWVLTFEIDTSHRPLLLAARPAGGQLHDGEVRDYTEDHRDALTDADGTPEPEAVPRHVLDKYADDAAKRKKQNRGLIEQQLIDEARELEQMVDRFEKRLQRHNIPETRKNLRVAKGRLQSVQEQLGKRKAAAA